MPARLGLLLALLVAALAAFSLARFDPLLAPNLADDLALVALVVGAFLAGAGVSLFLTLLRDVGRTFRDARRARQAWREERTDLRSGERADTRNDPAALRAARDLAASAGRWEEALEIEERFASLVGAEDRPAEREWLAGIHYEIGKSLLREKNHAEARRHLSEALKVDPAFVPAQVALGDAWEQAGDRHQAVRIWKRATEVAPAPVLLNRLENVYRSEGRPALMIALYQEALARAPEDSALAFALGRVYFELEMLDEAADQFQKLEVRAPDLAPLHAFLGTIYERRGRTAEAFEEYRRALRLMRGFDGPHHCAACGAGHTGWQDRCPHCGRWNSSRA